MFGDQPSVGKAVIDEGDKTDIVADARSIKPEDEGGEGDAGKAEGNKEVQKTAEEIAAEAAAAAGGTGKTAEEIAAEDANKAAETDQQATIDRIRKEAEADFYKQFGVKNADELKAKLNPLQPLTEEQKAEQNELYNANLAKFAVENKVFTNNEWLEYHNIQKMPDADLVYKDFELAYKEANKDRKNDDGADPVTDDEIRDKFNELFHIDSESKALKEQGEKNIALRAATIKEPLKDKFEGIKEAYDSEQAQRQALPGFKTFFQDVLKTSIPDKLTFGEGDKQVNVDLSDLNKDEFERTIFSEIGNNEFKSYMEGKGTPEQQARIKRAIEKELFYQKREDIAKLNYDSGVSAGTKAGAQGSQHRFTEPSKTEVKKQSAALAPENQKKIASAFA